MKEQRAQFETSLDSLEPIGAFISRFMSEEAALSAEKTNNFEVSVDEHVSNLIEHAFPNDPNHLIDIICRHDETLAQVVIADDSAGFDPRHYTIPNVEGTAIYELPPGGFGNYFICKLMDKVEYVHQPHVRNELILTVFKEFRTRA